MPQFSWLASFNHMVGSIGQITELLGMNAEALNFSFGSFVNFVERMAFMFQGMLALLAPRPVNFPPGHPQHNPHLPVGEETEEERKARFRRIKIVRFVLGVFAIFVVSKASRKLISMVKRFIGSDDRRNRP